VPTVTVSFDALEAGDTVEGLFDFVYVSFDALEAGDTVEGLFDFSCRGRGIVGRH
jgi:hypothetical protein